MKTKKTFDCVRLQHRGGEQIMRQLEGESLQEQLEYWQKGTEDLKRHQQELRQKAKRPK